MTATFCEIREKDVINVCDGRRLGYVTDLEIDTDCGKITAIYVCERYFSVVGGKNQIKICWGDIKCIGGDTILVDIGKSGSCSSCSCDDKPRCDRRKKSWFFTW